nr:MAG TPA: NUMOD4 motif protein [Caudoviricetes sp.]
MMRSKNRKRLRARRTSLQRKGAAKDDSFVYWRSGCWRLGRYLCAGAYFLRALRGVPRILRPPDGSHAEEGKPVAVSEAWRDVPGYGGKYQASDMGRIANTFWRGQRRKNGGRAIMAQFKKKPHGKARDSAKRFVHLTDLEGHRKEVSAAKVVAETFLGPVPPGMAIFHKNGNPADNSVWNLVFRTPEEIGRMTGADSTRRPVLKFSATGELLECYSSARQAAKQNYFSYQAIIDRCNGKCKRHILAPDGNYYAWDNTVGVRKAKEDLRALARQEGRLFAPKNWPAT